MGPETKLKNNCLKWVKGLAKKGEPIKAIKIAGGPRQKSGQPDVFLCVTGLLVTIELKAPGEEPTKLQAFELNEWRKAGAITAAVDNLADFQQIVLETLGRLSSIKAQVDHLE